MIEKIAQNDMDLLVYIGEHKMLTISQLSALSRRSRQVVRRRIRALTGKSLIASAMLNYGRSRGRPEDVVYLTEKGTKQLSDEAIFSKNLGCMTHNVADTTIVHHELLLDFHRLDRLLLRILVNACVTL